MQGWLNDYQDYLIDKYNLEPLDVGDDIPFYLNYQVRFGNGKQFSAYRINRCNPLQHLQKGKRSLMNY